MKKHYCGPSWMPNLMRKWLSGGHFNVACKLHDIRYEPGKIYTRKQADKMFLADMLKGNTKTSHIIKSYTLYYAVRLFGWIQFKK